MTMSLTIRTETPSDEEAIRSLTESAFRDMPFADGDEQDVIDRLRSAGDLHLSLVALSDQEIVGQVTFSRASAPDASQSWFALGPVSVVPRYQGQGIGAALIEQGLEVIRLQGAAGCILTGNPQLYQKFGFMLAPEHVPANEPAEYFMIRAFTEQVPRGKFGFHPAFYGDA